MVQATDINDLINATLAKYGRNMMTDAMSELQFYPAAERMLAKKRVIFDSGSQYKFNLIHTADTNARAVGFYEVDDLDIVDGTVQGTIPWRFVETGTFYDVKEVSVNQGAEQIFNLVKSREFQMWQGYFDLIESYFWGGPASSADAKVPFGLLKYWLDYDANTGFNGGNHASFTGGPAGISCATYDKWSHFTANYAAVSDSDLIRKMRRAYTLCDFRGIPNKPVKDYADGVGHRYEICTTYDTLYQMEELLDSKNDNPRSELAKYDGTTVFRRIPVTYVPYLEKHHATSDPVIGLDWNTFKTVALQGEWMRETPYGPHALSHDIRRRFVNSSFNFAMHDRRKNFLIAKSDPMSD